MKTLLACLFALLSTAVGWAQSSFTASNHYTLIAGQADVSNPTNFNVVWPTFSYDFILNTALRGGVPPHWLGATPSVAPGHGFVMSINTSTATLALANPTSVVLPLQLPAGWSIICCQSNIPATFEMMVGRPPTEGTLIYRLLTNYSGTFPVPAVVNDTNYTVYRFFGGSWSPEAPVVGVGEAVWIFQPPVISNLLMTNGTITFGALTGSGTSTAVEWTDSLTGTWQTLTNFPSASGDVTNVVDSVAPDAPTQRFYRLNMAETAH